MRPMRPVNSVGNEFMPCVLRLIAMPTPPPLLTEGLPIRRLGVVTQATVSIRRDDTDPYAGDKPERRLMPVIFPAQIPLEGG